MIIQLPNQDFSNAGFSLVRSDEVIEYASGAEQVTSFGKAIWSLRLTLPPLTREQLRQWRAALAQLSALDNRFEAGPPEYTGPSTGYAGPAPTVNGAGQLGNALAVAGLPASTTILRAGDYFSVDAANEKELKIITADVVSNASGQASIQFEPALRNAPASGSVVEIFSPKARFRLVSSSATWSVESFLDGAVSIEAVESFAP